MFLFSVTLWLCDFITFFCGGILSARASKSIPYTVSSIGFTAKSFTKLVAAPSSSCCFAKESR